MQLPENQYLKSQLGSYYKNSKQLLTTSRRSESKMYGSDSDRREHEDIMTKVVGEIETHQQSLKARLTKMRNSELNSSNNNEKPLLASSHTRSSVDVTKRSPEKADQWNVDSNTKSAPRSPAER